MMVGLAVVVIALVAQVRVLWRHMTRVHAAWWGRLPLVLPLAWAVVCIVEAEQANISLHDVERPAINCPPIDCHALLHCYPPLLDGQAQVALLGAICLLLAGWLTASALGRRIRAA